MKTGFYENISEEEYFSGNEISSSLLKDAAFMTASKVRQKMNQPKEDRKKHLDLGSALHCAVLQPEIFEKSVAILPSKRRPTKSQLNAKKPSEDTVELIKFWNEWDEVNSDKFHITVDDSFNIENVLNSIKNNSVANDLLYEQEGRNEISGYATVDSYPVRIRMDRYLNNGDIVDIKTCANASLDKFKYDAFRKYKWGYQIQGAFYKDVCNIIEEQTKKRRFIWVCIETEPPYDIAIYELGKNLEMQGRAWYSEGFEKLNLAMNSDKWHGYPEEIQILDTVFTGQDTDEQKFHF